MAQIITKTLKEYWLNPNAFASTLITMYMDLYGTEGLTWNPGTIQIEIEQDFSIDLPSLNYNKLMVAINLLTTDSFYISLPDFNRDCCILSGHLPSHDMLMLPSALDIAWGVTEAMLISPPEDKNEDPFNEEIIGYISEVVKSEGILNPPDILRLATRDQELLNNVNYDYSDDEELFSSIWKFENDKSSNINLTIQTNMHNLIMQLQELPLKHGKASVVAEKMLRKLNKGHDQSIS